MNSWATTYQSLPRWDLRTQPDMSPGIKVYARLQFAPASVRSDMSSYTSKVSPEEMTQPETIGPSRTYGHRTAKQRRHGRDARQLPPRRHALRRKSHARTVARTDNTANNPTRKRRCRHHWRRHCWHVSRPCFWLRQGTEVVVCEKGLVGAEQSSRNWGWVRQMGRDEAELPLTIAGLSPCGEILMPNTALIRAFVRPVSLTLHEHAQKKKN